MSLTDELGRLKELRSRSGVAAHGRINGLLEPNTFVETDAFLGTDTPGEGVITGFGVINGRSVFIYAHDFELQNGALGEKQAQKIAKTIDKAAASGTPVVGIINSNGARIAEGIQAVAGYGRMIKSAVAASGQVPHIVVIDGVAAGAMALFTQCADVVVMQQEATLSVGAPSVAGSLKNAAAAAACGSAALTATSAAEADAIVRALITYLPDNNLAPAYVENTDDINRLCEGLRGLAETVFDVRSVLAEIADENKYIELYASYAPEMITALTSVGGVSVGIVANNYASGQGKITSAGAKKAAGFIRLCDSFALPVITLADTEGFVSDSKEEKAGLAKDAAKLAYAYAEASSPQITVILTHAIGSGLLAMGSGALGADTVYAWAGAQIGPMPAGAALSFMAPEMLQNAADPIAERAALEEQYAKEHMSALAAAQNGFIDEPIDPAYTRMYIVSALDALCGKRPNAPTKSNMPL